jgi:hypothetical protein
MFILFIIVIALAVVIMVVGGIGWAIDELNGKH